MLAEENRRMLSERGVVIYLKASADELYRRVARDRNRPLLQTANPQEKLRSLLVEREPLYDSVADITFETGTLSIAQAVRALVVRLQNHKVTTP